MRYNREDVSGGGGSKFLNSEGPHLMEVFGIVNDSIRTTAKGNLSFKLELVSYSPESYGKTFRQNFVISPTAIFTLETVGMAAWGLKQDDGSFVIGPDDWSPNLADAEASDADVIYDAFYRRPFVGKLKAGQPYASKTNGNMVTPWELSFREGDIMPLDRNDLKVLAETVTKNGMPEAIGNAEAGPFWEWLLAQAEKVEKAGTATGAKAGQTTRSQQTQSRPAQATQTRSTQQTTRNNASAIDDDDGLPF